MTSRIPETLVVLALGVVMACSTLRPGDPEIEARVDMQVVARLSRNMPGVMSALYHLRVPSTGGLRLAVVSGRGWGQMSVMESFGSMVTLSVWKSGQRSVFDMKNACRIDRAGLESVLGVGALPLEQAARMLGGRLPRLPEDRVAITEALQLVVEGDGFRARVHLASDPWRVVGVENADVPRGEGWRVSLGDHTGEVPGEIRFVLPDGDWAELSLVGLQWDAVDQLPPPPEFPLCEEE